MYNKKIIRNSAKCRQCGNEIESFSNHDSKTCYCGAINIDGGKMILKRSGNHEDFIDTSIVEEDSSNPVTKFRPY